MSEYVWARWMTVDICSKYVGRTTAAIRRLVFLGEIPYHHCGKRVTFDRFKIDKWAAGQSWRDDVA